MQIEHCDFPDDALYDLENNVWVRQQGQRAVIVGITSVLAALAGRLMKVRIKPVATRVRRGQSVATIESPKYFGVVRTPVSGTVVERNLALEKQPKLANNSPYEDGWVAKIEPNLLEQEIGYLQDPGTAQAAIRAHISELRIHCFKAYPDYDMWEIGVECAAALVRLNELIERSAVNDVIHLVSDDATADIEMQRWSDETGHAVLESRREGKLAHFIVKKVK